MATTKFPIQLPEVVTETATPEEVKTALKNKISNEVSTQYQISIKSISIIDISLTSNRQWEYFTSHYPYNGPRGRNFNHIMPVLVFS